MGTPQETTGPSRPTPCRIPVDEGARVGRYRLIGIPFHRERLVEIDHVQAVTPVLLQFNASGDPTQQDCVDEATNTTSYLMFLQSRGLLKHHTVDAPMAKGNLLRGTLRGTPVAYWPHWTAVLKENDDGQRYAVDSWIYENGENPAVVKIEDWYIKDIDNLPDKTT